MNNSTTLTFTPLQWARMQAKKPLRLPRKLKKDIIKTAGRENYNKVMLLMAYQVINGQGQYLNIRKAR